MHAHVEIKINGVWRHWSALNRPDRNYWLFGRMAGVRGGNPIAEPRGLPGDVTFETKFDSDFWDGDGHTHSWLGCAEVHNLGKEWEQMGKAETGRHCFWEREVVGYIFGNEWLIHSHPNDYPKGVEDARLVFWFDN